MSQRTYEKILAELGYPPIYKISPTHFEHVEGDKIGGDFGISSMDQPVFTTHKGLRGKVLANTIWHEVIHKLEPSWRHWKVECAAERMAKGGGRGAWSKKYDHSVDEVPARQELLKILRRAAKRMKK